MRVIAAVAIVSLTACASPCPTPQTAPTSASFSCQDGSTMHVTFTHAPERALIEQEGFAAITLPMRIVGSGFRFSDGATELRGRTNEAHWTRPGAAETICREIQPGTEPAGS